MKKLLVLILTFPSAAMCMDSDVEDKSIIEQRVVSFLQKRSDPIQMLVEEIASALNNHESIQILTPMLRRLKLSPVGNWKYHVRTWACQSIGNGGNKPCQEIHNQCAVFLSCGIGSYDIYAYPPWPPHMSAVEDKNPTVLQAILEHFKKFYSAEKCAQTKESIVALFRCLNRVEIKAPREIKKIIIDYCINTLLPPNPHAADRLEEALSWETRIGVRAYDCVKNKSKDKLGYDPELLNPKTAEQQYHQAYLDNCARFRKTIFK
jgi:hypothetical protein